MNILLLMMSPVASEVPVAYVVLNEGMEGKRQVAEELVEYVATNWLLIGDFVEI
jgi:acyl-coenzyme A synthetase/AMP-(fatty) acid ligase